MNDLISVIVPVYNVEKYLDRCVQSIVDQTYKNLEIILIDDGSPDNCPQMCDAWADKDNRIKVIHKENGGLSDARNAGMAIATGEYIAFVDSDDWIEPQMYQCLYEAILATGSDIASCGAKRVWDDGRTVQELQAVNIDCVMETEAAMKSLITAQGIVQTVWNKLYRRNVTEGVPFFVGLIHEDEFWTWKVIAKAKLVVTVKESYYNYLQRSSSIMGAGFTSKGLIVVQAITERQNYIEKFMPVLIDTGRASIAYTCMHLGIQVIKTMGIKYAAGNMDYLKNTVKSFPVGKEYLKTLSFRKRLHLQLIQRLFVPVCLVHSI